MVNIGRFDVVLVNLDPTIGAEIKKVRPCVIIAPDSMNKSQLRTTIVAPMTSTIRDNFPTRINVKFLGKNGQVAIDQLRAIDKQRIIKNLGHIQHQTQAKILATIHELLCE